MRTVKFMAAWCNIKILRYHWSQQLMKKPKQTMARETVLLKFELIFKMALYICLDNLVRYDIDFQGLWIHTNCSICDYNLFPLSLITVLYNTPYSLENKTTFITRRTRILDEKFEKKIVLYLKLDNLEYKTKNISSKYDIRHSYFPDYTVAL